MTYINVRTKPNNFCANYIFKTCDDVIGKILNQDRKHESNAILGQILNNSIILYLMRYYTINCLFQLWYI